MQVYTYISVLLCAFVLAGTLQAQNVRIGLGDLPGDPSALLHLDNTGFPVTGKKGLVIPNVSLTRTDDPAPLAPLPLPPSVIVFNTASSNLAGVDAQYNVVPGYYAWDGMRWLRFEGGHGKQTYVNCSSGLRTLPTTTAWATNNANSPPGMQTNASVLTLQTGDRVILEAYGGVRLTSAAGDAEAYTDVEIELCYVDGGAIWTPTTVIASTVVSLDTRSSSGAGSSFFFGLFSSSSSGLVQRMAFQHWSLVGIHEVTTACSQCKFWIRARRLRAGTAARPVTMGTPGDITEGCLRTEIHRF